MSTCREEILDVASFLLNGARDSFTPIEVVDEMRRRGSRYAESTIRTHVTSLMCINAPINHPTTYPDFERVDRGQYRFVDSNGAPNRESSLKSPMTPVTRDSLAEVPAGNSGVQRHAETVALRALAAQYGFNLNPERISLPSGVRVEVDGMSHDPPVLVEVWAHQGTPKPAQRNKVLSDALKLKYLNDVLEGEYRMVLCLTDAAAAAPFLGRSWYADALQRANIDVEVVEIPDELRVEIQAAQARQFR